MAGRVVAAIRGDRANYRTLSSPLGDADDPPALAAALVGAVSSTTLYIADLDAITGHGAQGPLVATIAARLPDREIWVDAGAREVAQTLLPAAACVPVFGTETLASIVELEGACRFHGRRWILSLDSQQGRQLGAFDARTRTDLWPDRVIVMTLERVGSNQGPALDELAALVRAHPEIRFFAAGGVRDAVDLDRLRDVGAAGALVATAIHRGTVFRSRTADS